MMLNLQTTIPMQCYNRDPLPVFPPTPSLLPPKAVVSLAATAVSADVFAASLKAFGSRRKLSSPEKRLPNKKNNM